MDELTSDREGAETTKPSFGDAFPPVEYPTEADSYLTPENGTTKAQS